MGSVLLEARAIGHYIDYNNALCSGDDLPELIPAFYPTFAQEINKHNNSGYFWAYAAVCIPRRSPQDSAGP
jgi:hypothetical protein